jgi:hypothetical protein
VTISPTKYEERSVNAVATGATPSGTTRRSTTTIEFDCNKAPTGSADRSTRERAATESETVRTFARTSMQVTLPASALHAPATYWDDCTLMITPLADRDSSHISLTSAASARLRRRSRRNVACSVGSDDLLLHSGVLASGPSTTIQRAIVRNSGPRCTSPETWSTVVASTPHANGG